MPAITPADLNNAAVDVATIGGIANSTDPTVTTRLGAVVPTLAGITADFQDDLAALIAYLMANVATVVNAEVPHEFVWSDGPTFTLTGPVFAVTKIAVGGRLYRLNNFSIDLVAKTVTATNADLIAKTPPTQLVDIWTI